MKILIDMNLSPDWAAAFAAENIESVHWQAVGDPRAEDAVIMEYARGADYIVFTHDLDFGTLLALTQAESPSVIRFAPKTFSLRIFQKQLSQFCERMKKLWNEER